MRSGNPKSIAVNIVAFGTAILLSAFGHEFLLFFMRSMSTA